MARPPAPPDPDTGQEPALYTPAEFAALIRVDTKTIARWDKDGKIPADKVVRTLGGVRRYDGPWVRSLLNGGGR